MLAHDTFVVQILAVSRKIFGLDVTQFWSEQLCILFVAEIEKGRYKIPRLEATSPTILRVYAECAGTLEHE
jgi:hypothetical protein